MIGQFCRNVKSRLWISHKIINNEQIKGNIFNYDLKMING
jgi:hypothetical protein